MANFTITVTNTVRTFGMAPDKWGVMNWGDKWGEGTATIAKSRMITLRAQTITPVFSESKKVSKAYAVSLAPTMTIGRDALYTSNGYYYQPVAMGSFTCSTTGSGTWTLITSTTSVWS